MNLMSDYINHLRSLAKTLIHGSRPMNERQRFLTQLINPDDKVNLFRDIVATNKIDLLGTEKCRQDLLGDKIQVARKIYYCRESKLKSDNVGFVDRCKAVLSGSGDTTMDMPKELSELILS